jgi:uncharacterized protein YqeY
MTIEKRIETDFLKAFKERNTEVKSLLSTVKGEMQTTKKNLVVENLSDEESFKILGKFAKNLRENIRLVNDEKSQRELSVIEAYLPKQMSEKEVIVKLDEILASGVTNIGQIMKEFSQLPVDKKMVSELAKKKMS